MIRVWGGPGDPNSVTRPLSAVNRTTSNVDFGTDAFANDEGGLDTVLGMTGADLPADVVSGQTIGHIRYDGNGAFLQKCRHEDIGGHGRVPFGMGGSGDISFHPLAVTWPNGFAALYDVDGGRIRYGGSARPTVLAMHDRGYLVQRAKVVPAMNLALPETPLTNQFKPKHIVGSSTYWSYRLSQGSNGPEDDRLGYINTTSAASLWAPADEARFRRAVALSLSFMYVPMVCWDERSGVDVVQTRGPLAINDSVTTYPGMGPVEPQWSAYCGENGVETGYWDQPVPHPKAPGFFHRDKWKPLGGGIKNSGFYGDYGRLLDGQHIPNYHLVPWLKTGDYVHYMAMRAVALTTGAGNGYPLTAKGKTERVWLMGGRNFAWTTAVLSNYLGMAMDADPSKRMATDIMQHQANWFGNEAPKVHAGRFIGQVFGKGASYMMAYAHVVVAQELLKGKFPQFAPALENAAIWSVSQYDDVQGPIPNGAYQFGIYGNDADNYAGGGTFYPSLMAFKQATQAQYGTLPYPATGMAAGGSGLTDTGRAEICALRLMASCHAMGLATIPGAKRVEDQIMARGFTLEPAYSTTGALAGKLLPQWDMVSLLPPPATVVPNAVTGEAASNVRARTATVSWSKPTAGGPVFSYRIEVKKGSAAYAILAETWDATSIDLNALADNTTNLVRITARNPAGLSTASAVVSFTTPIEVTGTLTGAAANVGTPATFTAVFANIASVWVTLRPVGGADYGSRVQVSTSGGTAQITASVTALQEGAMYTAQAGGDLIGVTSPFTPGATVSSLYDYAWYPTGINGASGGASTAHNSVQGSFNFLISVRKKAGGGQPDGDVKLHLVTPGGTPPGNTIETVTATYNGQADHQYGKDYWGYYFGSNFELWVETSDGHFNKDPSGIYYRDGIGTSRDSTATVRSFRYRTEDNNPDYHAQTVGDSTYIAYEITPAPGGTVIYKFSSSATNPNDAVIGMPSMVATVNPNGTTTYIQKTFNLACSFYLHIEAGDEVFHDTIQSVVAT